MSDNKFQTWSGSMSRSSGSTAPIPPTESDEAAGDAPPSSSSPTGMEEEHKFWLQRSLTESLLACFEVRFFDNKGYPPPASYTSSRADFYFGRRLESADAI